MTIVVPATNFTQESTVKLKSHVKQNPVFTILIARIVKTFSTTPVTVTQATRGRTVTFLSLAVQNHAKTMEFAQISMIIAITPASVPKTALVRSGLGKTVIFYPRVTSMNRVSITASAVIC